MDEADVVEKEDVEEEAEKAEGTIIKVYNYF